MESERRMMWSMMGLMSLQSNGIPSYVQQLHRLWKLYRDNLSAYSHIEIPEFEESSMATSNEIYHSVGIYLSSLEATASAPRVSMTRPNRSHAPSFNLPSQHTITDHFQGIQVWWTHQLMKTEEKQGSRDRDRGGGGSAERKYVLKVLSKDRAKVLTPYIDHISKYAEDVQRRSQERKLFSNNECRPRWSSVAFKHPSTFETLALKPSLKEKIRADLDWFHQSRDFYRRTGRAWKRGYLLYGPPGTGKSSLIAAIANYMNYDVYDLELTKVFDNSCLRELLLATSSKSVVVIEDIDCAANLSAKAISRRNSPEIPNDGFSRRGVSTITLSGLLNFADGLWSSCGEERIMIFTTNHKERLDPALLRSGRMDMHILLSFCGFEAFKQLLSNYLDLGDHKLFGTVEEKMECGGCLTPAEICEILIQNQSDSDSAIRAVLEALEQSIAASSMGAERSLESHESENEFESSVEEEEEDSACSSEDDDE